MRDIIKKVIKAEGDEELIAAALVELVERSIRKQNRDNETPLSLEPIISPTQKSFEILGSIYQTIDTLRTKVIETNPPKKPKNDQDEPDPSTKIYELGVTLLNELQDHIDDLSISIQPKADQRSETKNI